MLTEILYRLEPPRTIKYIKTGRVAIKLCAFFILKTRRIKTMDETANLNLIGHSVAGNKRLRSIEAVADFICKHGKYGDVKITSNGETFITTIGIYLDKVADIKYRAKLMPVLTKKQEEMISELNESEETEETGFTQKFD